MYQKIQLPYSYDALEPFLSARTINIHFNRHYQNYLNKLNEILNQQNYDYKYSKEELVDHISEFPLDVRDDILYNLGGVLNHELYFLEMGRSNNVPVGAIKEQIEKQYSSFLEFQEEFIRVSKQLVGSGYTFLVLNKQKNLEIINTSNQETPYSYGLIPILALDLWEHAYYLDYQNKRNDYVENFFQNIDFNYVNKQYEKALQEIKES